MSSWNTSLVDGPVLVPDDDGYHLNVAAEADKPEFDNHEVVPFTPIRVLADAPTVFLRFTNEAEAIEVMPELRAGPEST